MNKLERWISLVLIIFFSCNQKECKEIEWFSLEDNYLEKVRSLNYAFEDSVDNPNGNRTHKAFFFSCDRKVGYFLYIWKDGEQGVNPRVPIDLWYKFKKSPSKDLFYGEYIYQKFNPKIKMVE